MTEESVRLACVLEPLDVLFFRDGRPFGQADRAQGHPFPMPQTFAGAVTTALLETLALKNVTAAQILRSNDKSVDTLGILAQLQLLQLRFRGLWPARRHASDSNNLQLLLPTPTFLHRAAKQDTDEPTLHPLQPCTIPLPGWEQSPRWPPVLLQPLRADVDAATEPAGGWLSLEGWKQLIQGTVPDGSHWVRDSDIVRWDYRTGVGIEPGTYAASEGMIYAVRFLALGNPVSSENDIVFYGEVEAPSVLVDALQSIASLALGGEARRVRVSWREAIQWPQANPPRNGQVPFVALITPGIFQEGWVPQVLKDKVMAAAVAEPLAVSGWDLARAGPKPLRWAAPAGSTLFLKTPLDPSIRSLADDDEDQRIGWGCYLQGVCP